MKLFHCSQKKAVRPRNKQLMEDHLDNKEDNKPIEPWPDIHKLQSHDSLDGADSLSSKNKAQCKISDHEATLTVPKTESTEPNDKRISVTLTSSPDGRPSKTFMTELKTTDPSMVSNDPLIYIFSILIYIYYMHIYMCVYIFIYLCSYVYIELMFLYV